jgi:GC-rich sequence DNA-binding factor-like protein/G-patch domain
MQHEFIPFDSDEELPHKRGRLSKEEQIYGVFYDKTGGVKAEIKPKKPLGADELGKTYGKGLAMLQKHGYKVGTGLGKNNQGSTDLIGIQLRKKNEGLSFSKPETQPVLNNLDVHNGKLHKKPSKAHTKTYSKDLGTDLNENYYSDSIEDPQENELSKKIRIVQDSVLSLSYEEKQINQNIQELDQKESEITQILKIISSSQHDFQSSIRIFREIKKLNTSIYHELFIYENFAVIVIRGFFYDIWDNWKFNKSPLKGLNELKLWMDIGRCEDVIDIWLLSVAHFFSTAWKPKDELGNNIDAMEVWKQYLPVETWESIKKTITARISSEIDQWEPNKDTIAIHSWVHSWLALIDLSSLWPKVIYKLVLALQNWNAKDRSAKLILYPWKPVLIKEWDDLVIQNILPKLLYLLQELEITEEINKSTPIKYILDWVDLIPIEHFIQGFKIFFYPKWKKTLEGLLEKDTDMDKVVNWVQYWKGLLPDEIISLDF